MIKAIWNRSKPFEIVRSWLKSFEVDWNRSKPFKIIRSCFKSLYSRSVWDEASVTTQEYQDFSKLALRITANDFWSWHLAIWSHRKRLYRTFQKLLKLNENVQKSYNSSFVLIWFEFRHIAKNSKKTGSWKWIWHFSGILIKSLKQPSDFNV